MINRISPKTDFVFRKLFGSDENKDLLISLINSLVGPEIRFTDVTIKNPFNLAEYPRQKQSILDIKAVDENGVWYDIEMQIIAHTALDRWVSFLNRAGELTASSMPAELIEEPAITKVMAELERIGMDPSEREIYEGVVKALMVDQIQIRSAEERGIEIGRQEGSVQSVVRLLTRKLGDVPTSIFARIAGLSTVELDDLIADALVFTSYGDVESWIGSRRGH
jgi:hypothetical protein